MHGTGGVAIAHSGPCVRHFLDGITAPEINGYANRAVRKHETGEE